MWIRKRNHDELISRIKDLEAAVRVLNDSSRAYIGRDEDTLVGWPNGEPLVNYINAIARHLGIKWRRIAPEPSRIESVAVGKPAVNKEEHE